MAADDAPSRLEAEFPPYGTLRWEVAKTPVLLIEPARGDGWITIAQRFTGSSRIRSTTIKAANPGLRQVRLDRRVAVPVELLRGDLRLAVVRRIFPLDHPHRRGLGARGSRPLLRWRRRDLGVARGALHRARLGGRLADAGQSGGEPKPVWCGGCRW